MQSESLPEPVDGVLLGLVLLLLLRGRVVVVVATIAPTTAAAAGVVGFLGLPVVAGEVLLKLLLLFSHAHCAFSLLVCCSFSPMRL